MTELAEVAPDHVVLEVGTGSGYQAAILAHLARKVCTIEIIPSLAEGAAARRRPRALCALNAITKLKPRNGPAFEGAGLEGSPAWLETCGNARLEQQ